VSRSRKDSKQNRVLDVVKKPDGTFDLFLNRKPDRHDVPEAWLQEELCVRFGFCGEEYDSILRELNQHGRKELFF
jgi:hypothetical protein